MDSNEHEEVLRMINKIPLFSGVGIHEQNMIVHRCFILNFKPGDIIIKQNEVADRLYAILQGSVDVIKLLPTKSVRISRLTVGDVFGEIAILRKIPRTANVVTVTHCKFLSIEGKDFLDIYQYFSAHARDNIQLLVEKRLAHQRDLI